jgi:hypothetical protein
MKLASLIILVVAASTVLSRAAETYPAFVRSQVQRFDLPIEDAFKDITALVAAKMGRDTTGRLEPGPELQLWVQQNRQWMSEQVAVFRAEVPSRTWPMVQVANRLPLPSVLANGGGGLVPGIDRMWSVHNLADDTKSALAIIRYGMFWQMVFENDPASAVSLLNAKASGGQATTSDVVELQSALAYWPGGKLTAPLLKSDWQALHQSANPLNRFIALEKFDSVEQSPTELLALYRECLFGACSYLEVRALEAITRNKDFREEVAKLLEEYIASNPPANDGTLPGLRNNFPNLIDGAKRVIATIRNTEVPVAPTSPQSDPFAQSTPTPKPPPMVQPPAPKNAPAAKPATTSEEPSSSSWFVWAVVIIAATGLLWLLLKGRK